MSLLENFISQGFFWPLSSWFFQLMLINNFFFANVSQIFATDINHNLLLSKHLLRFFNVTSARFFQPTSAKTIFQPISARVIFQPMLAMVFWLMSTRFSQLTLIRIFFTDIDQGFLPDISQNYFLTTLARFFWLMLAKVFSANICQVFLTDIWHDYFQLTLTRFLQSTSTRVFSVDIGQSYFLAYISQDYFRADVGQGFLFDIGQGYFLANFDQGFFGQH